jgi:transposase
MRVSGVLQGRLPTVLGYGVKTMAVGANETVVPASELQEAMRRIKQLEGALGRKTLENEILKEAVDFAKAKKWIARSPVLPGGEQ